MLVPIIIFAVTVALMTAGILFFPKIPLGRLKIDTYWVIALIGAAAMLIFGKADVPAVGRALIADTAVNPVKILVLFISMTAISVFLDGTGFFEFLAHAALRRAGKGQKKLFLILYVTVSVLTVFTSNDVIILSFTPFLLYFAKHAKIDPVPYLAAEFVAANTWSMALIIGNPTNIYLAGAFGIGFFDYFKVSVIPTLFAGVTAFLCLFALFYKRLSAPIEGEADVAHIKDKFLLIAGVVHLAVCTVLLAVSSYIGLEMWYIALAAAVSLMIFGLVRGAVKRRRPQITLSALKRSPWQLIPFVLSMFVMIVVLDEKGVTSKIAALLCGDYEILTYGVSSFLAGNIMNNIPMSVLFASVLGEGAGIYAVYATVIGSNLCAFLTPIGALAGIMFSGLLSRGGVKFGYLKFLKMGLFVAVPALFAALGGLYLSALIA